MTSLGSHARVGAFGKIPALGDFFRFGLPADFVGAWDVWLQEQLVHARGHLAERWSDCYLSAPIWRFSLRAGVAGAAPVSGVMMASVDRVGRQYPLTLAVVVANGETPFRHFSNEAFFEQLEDVALRVLDQDLDKTQLGDALEGISLQEQAGELNPSGVYHGSAEPRAALAAQAVAHAHGDCCIWSTAAVQDHRLFITSGLPEARQSQGFFDLNADMWQPADNKVLRA